MESVSSSTSVLPTLSPLVHDPEATTAAAPPTSLRRLLPLILSTLTCPSCSKLLTDPTTLPCAHTICLACLPPFRAEPIPPASRGGECPVEDCPGPTLHSSGRKPGSAVRLDFVLQKVLGRVKKEIGLVAAEMREVQRKVVVLAPTPEAKIGSDGMEGVQGRPREITTPELHREIASSFGTASTNPLLIATRTQLLSSLSDLPSTSLLQDLESELECQVCFALFHLPTTTLCGHVYCRPCLARSLDHSNSCPLCRTKFPSFAYFQNQGPTVTALKLIQLLFPEIAAERALAEEAQELEMGLSTSLTPIFICSLAFPSLPSSFHIFEPRYRLMMRRVLAGDRKFGMVLPNNSNDGPAKYGCILRIEDWTSLEDGRLIIEAVGEYRFKILEDDVLDGYCVAKIERLDDLSVEEEAELNRRALERSEESTVSATLLGEGNRRRSASNRSNREGARVPANMSVDELTDICMDLVRTLRSRASPRVLESLDESIGPMPDNPSEFSFWIAKLLPLSERVKSTLLEISSPRLRLELVVSWIDQFRSTRVFAQGC